MNVEQVRKKGLILINDYSLPSLGTFKNEIPEELKISNYNDVEGLVYRFQLTYDEIIDILDLKHIAASTKGYTLPPGVYEIIDNNFMLKCLLSKEVKVNFTIDDIRLNSNLTTKKTIRFTEKSFFYKMLGFIQSHSGKLGDITGFIQLIPDKLKSHIPINITRIDNIHLKCDCIDSSIVNGTNFVLNCS